MDLNVEMIADLKKEYGEAFYLLDSKKFKKHYRELKECFSAVYPRFNLAYSYKTNYIPKLCKIVDDFGGYAEVVSEMELELARRINVAPDQVIWNGPIKSIAVVQKLLLDGGCVNVDSLREMKQIARLAESHPDQILHIGIRCNFDIGDGVVSRFGFDVEGKDFKDALQMVSSHGNMELVSFQCHFAKRQIDYWKGRAQGMLEIIQNTGIVPERVDLGGGLFGYMPESLKQQFSSRIPSYREYAVEAASVIAEYFQDSEEKPELIIEPGSALVGDCMQFVGTIKTIKNVRGKSFASMLGSQKNISMSGVNPPITIVPMGKERKHYENIDIAGYTCIEGDVLYQGYNGELAEEDVVVIDNCGSYSVVMKPPFIMPNFAVLDISGDKIEVIKNAENFEDIFHTYNY